MCRPKNNTRLMEDLSKASGVDVRTIRYLVKDLAEVAQVDLEKLTLLRSMESLAEEKGIRL